MDATVAKATVTITPDMSKFGEELKAQLDEAMAGAGKDISSTSTLGVDNEEANRALDETQAKADGLSGSTLKLGVDNTEADLKIDESSAKADLFGAKHETAKLDADASDMRKELDATKEHVDALKERFDVLKEAATGAGGGLGTTGEGASEAGGGISGILMPALVALTPALVPIAGIATGAALGLAGMGTAIGASIGAFAVAAIPVYKQVSTAMQTIATDQAAVQNATTAAAKNTAIEKLTKEVQGLNPEIAGLVMQVDQAKSSFMAWDQQFQPAILSVFSSAIALVGPALQAMTPLVYGGAQAIGEFLDNLKQGLSSGGMQAFTKWAGTEAPAALHAFQEFAGGIFAGLGKMFEALTPVIHSLEGDLEHLGTSFDNFASSDTFKSFVQYIITEGPAVGQFFGQLFQFVERLVVTLAPAGAILLRVITDVVKGLNSFMKDFPDAARIVLPLLLASVAVLKLSEGFITLEKRVSEVMLAAKGLSTAFAGGEAEGVAQKIAASMGSLKLDTSGAYVALMEYRGAAVAAGEAGEEGAAGTGILGAALEALDGIPVVLIIAGIVAAIAVLALGAYELYEHWNTVWSGVKEVVGDAVDFIKAHLLIIAAIVVPLAAIFAPMLLVFAALGIAAYELYDHWTTVWHGITSVFDIAVSFVKDHAAEFGIALVVILGPLGLLIDGVVLLATHWSLAFNTMRDVVKDVVNFFTGTWGSFVNWFSQYSGEIEEVLHGIEDVFRVVFTVIATTVEVALGVIVSTFRVAFAVLSAVARPVLEAIEAFFRLNMLAIETIVRLGWPLISGIFKGALDLIKGLVEGGLALLDGLFKVTFGLIAVTVRTSLDVILAIVKVTVDLIRGVFEVFLDLVTGHWSKAWHDLVNTVTSIAGAVTGAVKSVFSDLLGYVTGAITTMASAMLRMGMDMIDGLLNGLQQLWSGVANFFTSMPGKILGFLSGAATLLVDIGKDLLQGLVKGMESGIDTVVGAAKSIGKRILGGFKDVLSIFSPSKATADMGTNLNEGMALGLNSSSQTAVAAAKRVANQITQAFGSLDSVKGVASAVQSLRSVFSNLAQVFTSLVTATSKAGQVSTDLPKLHAALMTLASGMPQIVSAINSITSGMGKLSDTKGLSTIGTTFSSLGQVFSSFGKAAKAAGDVTLVTVFEMLGGLKLLGAAAPAISSAILTMMDAFKKIDSTKSVGTNLGNLGSVLKTLGGIFGDFGKLAKTSSDLSVGALIGILVGLKNLDKASPLIVGDLKGIEKAFSGLGNLKNLNSTLSSVEGALGKLGKVITDMASDSKKAATLTPAALGLIGAAVTGLVKSFSGLNQGTASSLQSFLNKVTSAKTDLTGFVAAAAPLDRALHSLTTSLTAASRPFGTLTSDVTRVVTAFQRAGSTVTTLVTNVTRLDTQFTHLRTTITATTAALGTQFLAALRNDETQARALAPVIQMVATQVAAASIRVRAAVGDWRDFGKGISDSLTSVRSMSALITSMATAFTASASSSQRVLTTLTQLKTSGFDLLTTSLTTFSNLWRTDWNLMLNEMLTFSTQVETLLLQLRTVGLQTLQTAMTTFSTQWRTDWELARTATTTAADSLRQVFSDIKTQGIDPTKEAMTQFKTSWSSDWEDVRQSVSGVWSTLSGTFSAIINQGLNPTRTALDSLESDWGISWANMATAVSNMWRTVGGVLSQLQTGLSNLSSKTASTVAAASAAAASGGVAPAVVKNSAAGNSLLPGEWSWVGEKGPELLFTGNSPATVLPNQMSVGLMGSAVNSQGLTDNRTMQSITATMAPTIVIQGANQSLSELQGMVRNAISQSNRELAQLIDAHS